MHGHDKPLGDSRGWRIQKTSYPFRSKHFNLRQDFFSRRGQEGSYTYVEHPGSVFVVPLTPDRRIVLIKSYRFTLDAVCWEVPAGMLGDRTDETPEATAMHELQEETGGTCKSLTDLGTYHMGNGYSNHKARFFLAHDVEMTARRAEDPFEDIIEVAPFTIPEIEKLIHENRIDDGDSALALLLAMGYLRPRVL